MLPTPVFAATWPAAARRLVFVLLGSTLVLFLAGTAMAAVDGPRPDVTQVFPGEVYDVDDLPDVSVTVAGVAPTDTRIDLAALPAIEQLTGVDHVSTRIVTDGRLSIDVVLADDAPVGAVDRVERTVAAVLPDASLSVGGRLPADQALLDGINRGLLVAVGPVVALVAVLIAAAFGWRVGLAIGLTITLSTALGGLLGARMAGTFDGTLGATAVPGVLVALLVSTVFAFRLLDWFRSRTFDDPAAAIEGAVRHLAPEVALLFGGIAGAALLLEAIDPGRTPASVVAAGGLSAALVTLGGLPAMLSAMPALDARDEYRLIGSFVPDGRDVPVAALAGFTCFLLGFGLFALRAPSSTLLDTDALADGSDPARVAAHLETFGDRSSGIVATFPTGIDPQVTVAWVAEADAVDHVADVELFAAASTSDAARAVVSLDVAGRSSEAQMAVADLDALPASSPELSGVPVAAASTSDAAGGLLWPLVFLLAVAGGLAVLLILGDLVLAAFATMLRLVGTAALLGIYHLVASGVSATELQIAALVLSIGVGLFEIGFLRRIRQDLDESGSPSELQARHDIVSEAFRMEGRAAMIGLGVASLCGIGLVAGELDAVRRLGVAIS
ncbi:MAG: hypothetical protein ACRBI6_14160, partial [Acidimicrobiales bacterium]